MERPQQDKHPITGVTGTTDLLSFKDQAEARKHFFFEHTQKGSSYTLHL